MLKRLNEKVMKGARRLQRCSGCSAVVVVVEEQVVDAVVNDELQIGNTHVPLAFFRPLTTFDLTEHQ